MKGIELYAIIAINTLLFLLSILTFNAFAVSFEGFVFLCSIIIYKAWDLIYAIMLKKSKAIEIIGNSKIYGSKSVLVRRSNNKFIATCASYIKISNSFSELNKDALEKIISKLEIPFKISLVVHSVDSNKILEMLKTKKRMKEIQYSSLENAPAKGKNSDKIAKLKAEIAALDSDIAQIVGGAKPLSIAYYVLTSAVSESRFHAEEEAKLNIKRLSNEFSSILNSSAIILEGADLARIAEIDSGMVK
ncbi:MAG: hypothetical protein ACP5RP_00790 [Candidatus Micrarchaeia archaeon]